MVNSLDWQNFQSNDEQSLQNNDSSNEYSYNPVTEKPLEKPSLAWGNFLNPSTFQGEQEDSENEGELAGLVRNIYSNTARVKERFAGKFGDIEQFARKTIGKNPEVMGILGKAIHDIIGPERWNELFYTEGTLLPTSNDLRQMEEKVTGQYTRARGKNEERIQQVTGDIGGMGRSPRPTRASYLYNNIGIPVASNLVKETVKELGYGDTAGEWSKLAAMTTLSLGNFVNSRNHAADLMNQGRQGFGPNVTANVPRYNNSLNRVSRNMLAGDERSALARQQIAGIENDIQNGQTTMQDLMNRYDAINASKRSRGLFELGSTDREAAIRNINQVRDVVREEIEHLGRNNPQALQAWQDGVQAFSVIHRSNALTNWVRNTLKDPYSKATVAGLFGAGAIKAPLIAAPLAAAGIGGYKTAQVAYRVWSDPTLATYYWQAMRAAARENGPAFLKSFNSLEKAYQKKYSDSGVTKSSKNDKKS